MSQIIIKLDSAWVLECSMDDMLPTDVIAAFIRDNQIGSVLKKDFTELVVAVEAKSEAEIQRLQARLHDHLQDRYQMSQQQVTMAVTVSVCKDAPVAEVKKDDTKQEQSDKKDEKKEEKKDLKAETEKLLKRIIKEPQEASKEPQEEPKDPQEPVKTAMDEICALHGAEQFTALCQSIQKMAPVFRRMKLQPICTSITYLFSMDKGCGYSTTLRLLSKLLQEESLLTVKMEPYEHVLEPESPNSNVLESAGRMLSNCNNRVVSIDISNWCDKVSSPEFRDFLLSIQSWKKEAVYVFRLPYLEHSVLEKIEETLSDVVRVQKIAFPPMAAMDLQQIAQKKLQEKGFTATEEAWELFQLRLAEEKSDGRFYGIRTVEKILDDMIFQKVQAIAAGDEGDENTIDAAVLTQFTDDVKQNLSAEEMLNKLVGMDKLRDKIYEFVNQIEFAKRAEGVSTPSMHMRFVGNPGTGKTTVARILGKLLKERGLLSKGYFFEHAGGDFIGKYVGHTAPKTLALCRDAYGSILFIDEAYTLANANYGENSGYSKEAIDTLIAQMENHRDDMVVIMAGYPNDMQRLMALNPGLPGRMPYVLEFPNYTREELYRIFMAMVGGSAFHLTDEAEAAVKAYFESLEDRVLNAPDFANARFARNLFERTWSKTVTRTQFDGSDLHTITKADFEAAVQDSGRTAEIKTSKRTRPGYHLGV